MSEQTAVAHGPQIEKTLPEHGVGRGERRPRALFEGAAAPDYQWGHAVA